MRSDIDVLRDDWLAACKVRRAALAAWLGALRSAAVDDAKGLAHDYMAYRLPGSTDRSGTLHYTLALDAHRRAGGYRGTAAEALRVARVAGAWEIAARRAYRVATGRRFMRRSSPL